MFDLFKRESFEGNETFVEAFIKNAQKHPNKIALVDEDGSYTYRELNQVSNGVATKLLEQGIGKGDIVPILMKRGKGFVAAFIGVMKSGAAFVPLDVNFPEQRIKFIENIVVSKYTINDKWMESVPFSDNNICNTKLEDNSFIIFTSGSTGMPKGVIHTHKSAMAMARAEVFGLGYKIGQKYLTILPLSFIGAINDYLSYLFAVGTIYIISEHNRKNGKAIVNICSHNTINRLKCGSSMGRMLLVEYGLSIPFLELGSEKLLPLPTLNSTIVINNYGCSEFALPAIVNENVSLGEETSIGKPTLGVNVFIVGDSGELVDNGEYGEICLVGPQIASGYWKMPELTAEKFVHCPFLPGNVTMYKTGDLARYREDGNIELVGRKDFQIKIRGYRIEPGEIENVAARFEGIDAVVVTAKEIGEEKHLVLYYTSRAEIDRNELREHLSRFLADYLVPNFFVRLDEMPRNANGKIDRSVLPAPAIVLKFNNTEDQITSIEHSLLDEVKKELHLQNIGLDDDLLFLGFTSLSSMFVQTRLEQKGINFSSGGIEAYKVFLKYRTIRNVAKYLENDND